MKIDEIWEFDNGIAYDLCRIVREEPVTAIHAQAGHSVKSAYLIRADSEGWTKVGEATKPLTFTPKIPNVKTSTK